MFVTTTSPRTIERALEALIESDRLIAEALDIIGSREVESHSGLSVEMLLVLGARRTGGDARALAQAATTLRTMPATAAAFGRADICWSQVRLITGVVRNVDQPGRTQIDDLIATNAPRLTQMDPDELIAKVDAAVASLRPDLSRAREDRQIQANFLAIQGHLDGSSTLYGQADAQSTATICSALDARAEGPLTPEDDAPTRAAQRMDALVGICEDALAGTGPTPHTRPRPRFIATVDVSSLQRDTRLLWNLVGRAPKLTALATQTLLCDATIQPVVLDGSRPVAVGDAQATVSSRLRTALMARDRGCRFPGCGAPVDWCDAHHIIPRIHHGPTVIDNLLLLCRRCHRRVHRYRWTLVMRDDGVITFDRPGHHYRSSPAVHARE